MENKPIALVAHDGQIFFCAYPTDTTIRVTNQYGEQTTGDRTYILRLLGSPQVSH